MTNAPWTIALDTTYSAGRNLSGVGIYSREISNAIARLHPEAKFLYCYRPHRFLRGLAVPKLSNVRRRVLWSRPPNSADLFHGLNQRLEHRYRRSVATFHDLFVLTGEYSTVEFRKRFAEQARQAAEHSDLIIAVSEFTALQVEALLKVERSRLRVIPHGVRVPHSGGAAAVGEAAREPIILFVGALQKRKNVRRLVEAFDGTPEGWKLVLAGSLGYGAGEVMTAVEQSRRRADISVTGYISDAELEAWYRRASLFAFPSLDEGFGIPVLEAMARGVPVMTSNRSALPEVAGDAALLVDPEETEAIRGGLNRLIAGDALRAELSQRGLERVAGYTWERAAKDTWAVYRELLSSEI